jgi:predicted PurR-regulated permease PerM
MAEERPSPHVIYRAVLLAGALFVLGLLFHQLVTLLLAVLMTIIIAIPLAAVATRLERGGLPRALGALIGLLAGLAVVALVVYLLIPPFVDETNHFVDNVPQIVDELDQEIRDLTDAKPGEVGDRVQDFARRYTDKPERLIGPITSVGLSLAGVVGALVLMLLTAYYMAIKPEPLIDGLLSLVPPAGREHASFVLGRLRRAWLGWMLGVAVDMLMTGLLLYAGLSLIGLDYAVFFAVLTAILVVVPYFGAIAGAIPPVLFALTDTPGKALLVLGVYVAVQQFESNITIPLVMAQAVRLHPAVIAIGVVVVGQLFGFIGLLVAVPILSLIVIGVDEYWVKPLEASARQRPPPDSAQLDDGDHHRGEAEDDDQSLHPDPEAGQLHARRSSRIAGAAGRERQPPATR